MKYPPRPRSTAIADEINLTLALTYRVLTARRHESCAECRTDVHGAPILWARGRPTKHVRCP